MTDHGRELRNASIADISLIKMPSFLAENGQLIVFEGNDQVPFSIARVFVARAGRGQVRGCHAHKQCTQLLTCLSGMIRVFCDDGATVSTFNLNSPDTGLIIPPGIWAEQTYVQFNSVLMVLCNRPYEADDYIRDYDFFKVHKR